MKLLPWILLSGITAALLLYFLTLPKVQLAGDIVEYYGITESLIHHGNIALTRDDQARLEQVLHKAYFSDPGNYSIWTGNLRYPVHFVFYSILATPVRLVLKTFSQNELASLAVTNVLLLGSALWYLFRRHIHTLFQRLTLLELVMISPLVFFIAWPGSDLFYLLALIIALFAFFRTHYLEAAFFAVLASWHSQPLLPLALAFIGWYGLSKNEVHLKHGKLTMSLSLATLGKATTITILATLPLLYNYLAFGMLTPWTKFHDGWTMMRGFGLHNLSLIKFAEQILDLNYGLFWYMPLIMLAGTAALVQLARKDRRMIVLSLLFVFSAFMYQTNPAWHYGTAGYGPSRHAIFYAPLFIFALVAAMKKDNLKRVLLLSAIGITQIMVLATNNFIHPNFELTLHHSPLATYVLTHAPRLYNPTPEIFVDRTTHTDKGYLHTAIFKADGACKKAYVTYTDVEALKDECGYIPPQFLTELEDPFVRKANTPRTLWTTDATLWPDPASCGPLYTTGYTGPFVCVRLQEQALTEFGISDFQRFTEVAGQDGVWRLEFGSPTRIAVPPGYIAHYTALEGNYVTY